MEKKKIRAIGFILILVVAIVLALSIIISYENEKYEHFEKTCLGVNGKVKWYEMSFATCEFTERLNATIEVHKR